MESLLIAIGEVHNISACEIKASGKAVGLEKNYWGALLMVLKSIDGKGAIDYHLSECYREPPNLLKEKISSTNWNKSD